MRTAPLTLLVGLLGLVWSQDALEFGVASELECWEIDAQVDWLADYDGPHSAWIPDLSEEWAQLQARYDAAQLVPVPYEGRDLSQLPREQITGLREEYTTREVTEPAPDYLRGALNLGAAALFGYLTYEAVTSDEVGTETTVLMGVLSAAGAVGAYGALTRTETREERIENQGAIAHNQRIRERVAQRNREIEQENRQRRAQLAERQRAKEHNESVKTERAEVRDLMSTLEDAGQEIVDEYKLELQQAGSRCLGRLAYHGALARMREMKGEISLIVTPLNRAGEVVADGRERARISFGVGHVVVSEDLGLVAEERSPEISVVTVTDPEALPRIDAAKLPASIINLAVELEETLEMPDTAVIQATLVAEHEGAEVELEVSDRLYIIED